MAFGIGPKKDPAKQPATGATTYRFFVEGIALDAAPLNRSGSRSDGVYSTLDACVLKVQDTTPNRIGAPIERKVGECVTSIVSVVS